MFASALNPENCKVLEEEGEAMLDDDRDFKKRATKYAEDLSHEAAARAPVRLGALSAAVAGTYAAASSASSGPPPAQDWRALAVLPDQAWDQTAAKGWLPIVTGCVISVHQRTRWMVKYQCDLPPRSFSMAFVPGDNTNATEALRECLLWAWRAHKQKTGAECPFNLGALV